ncbi:MAG: hypothetical protein HZB40_20530 [Rhodocyclales bacterium]|nr:hypothetical protein [Rhodocyclales bacterium]
MSPTTPQTSLPGKIVGLVAATILLVLGFMFSLALLAVFAVVALALGLWFFWKTRHLRKALREARAEATPPADGHVIEGEAIVVEDYRVDTTAVLPDDRTRSDPA